MVINIKENEFNLLDRKDLEDSLNEYKEFFLTDNLNDVDIHDLINGYINQETYDNIYKSILDYFDKYGIKYILSLTNIDKILLPELLNHNKSNLYIGISDDGTITGIPIHLNMLDSLKIEIERKLNHYYDNFIGLHQKKGTEEYNIGYDTYFNFEKLVPILKKHTNVTIHILKDDNIENNRCNKLLRYIDYVKNEEIKYKKIMEFNKHQMIIKEKYNHKYSQKFHLLIRSDIMIEFREFTTLNYEAFDNLLFVLHQKIESRDDTNIILKDGEYVGNTLYPNDPDKEIEYGNLFEIFLEEYKNFKEIQLKKNISIKKIKKKNPLKKLNGYMNNVSCFNNYLHNNIDIKYILISINIPIIKDKNVFLGYKKNNNIKIIQRGFDSQPFTIS